MNKRYLFLDDVRQVMDTFHYTKHPVYTEDNWDVVRNYNEFCNYIQDNGVPALISFDHDLADEHYSPEMYHGREAYDKVHEKFFEKTGYECAKWLVEYLDSNNLPVPIIYVHSMNPVGSQKIVEVFNDYKRYLYEK